MTAPTDFAALLQRLLSARVEIILIGGVAGNVHGSARATYDIDALYRRTPDNMAASSRRSRLSSPICVVRRPVCRSRSTWTRCAAG